MLLLSAQFVWFSFKSTGLCSTWSRWPFRRASVEVKKELSITGESGSWGRGWGRPGHGGAAAPGPPAAALKEGPGEAAGCRGFRELSPIQPPVLGRCELVTFLIPPTYSQVQLVLLKPMYVGLSVDN